MLRVYYLRKTLSLVFFREAWSGVGGTNERSPARARGYCSDSQRNSLIHQSSCVYHPAPLTKTRPSSDERPESVPSLPAGSNRASPYPSRNQQPAVPISPSSIQEESSGYSSAPTRSMQPSPMLPMTLGTAHGRQMSSTISHKSPDNFTSSFRNDRTGFLGPTAYSAVFTENSGKQVISPWCIH